MLRPAYDDDICGILDKIELDPSRRPLWDAINDVIDLICDRPDSVEARRQALDLPEGRGWLVTMRVRGEDDDWGIVWFPEGDFAVIVYVGPWPPAATGGHY